MGGCGCCRADWAARPGPIDNAKWMPDVGSDSTIASLDADGDGLYDLVGGFADKICTAAAGVVAAYGNALGRLTPTPLSKCTSAKLAGTGPGWYEVLQEHWH